MPELKKKNGISFTAKTTSILKKYIVKVFKMLKPWLITIIETIITKFS